MRNQASASVNIGGGLLNALHDFFFRVLAGRRRGALVYANPCLSSWNCLIGYGWFVSHSHLRIVVIFYWFCHRFASKSYLFGRKSTKKIPMLVKGVGINYLWVSINYELHEFDGFILRFKIQDLKFKIITTDFTNFTDDAGRRDCLLLVGLVFWVRGGCPRKQRCG